MFEIGEDIWYKSPMTDQYGNLGGTYTYFKIKEINNYDIVVDIYNFLSDDGMNNPQETINFISSDLKKNSRRVSKEELDCSIAYCTKFFLKGY